jgi:hypothetical protein
MRAGINGMRDTVDVMSGYLARCTTRQQHAGLPG